jgi:hypothetical protein
MQNREVQNVSADVQRHWSVVTSAEALRLRGVPTLNAAARRTLLSRWSFAD